MPFKNGNAHLDVMRQMHRAAFRNNLGVDFVLAENADFSGYQILLVPPLYIASDALLKKISDFVENGGSCGHVGEKRILRRELGCSLHKSTGPIKKSSRIFLPGIFYNKIIVSSG